MALAVTHVIITIVVLDFFRHYVFSKRNFPRYLLVIGGIAGLLPDLDMLVNWTYRFFGQTDFNFHGLYTHSIIFPILFLVFALILHYFNRFNKEALSWAKIFYVLSAGIFLHLLLDCFYGGYPSLFWPFGLAAFCPQWGLGSYASGIDALILIAWLVHEEIHKKIKDYF